MPLASPLRQNNEVISTQEHTHHKNTVHPKWSVLS